MVKRSQPYNQDQIDDLRARFFEKYPSGHEDFDERDIARVRKYDKYLYNILLISKSDVVSALQKLEKILIWRKEFEINDLTWDSFPDDIKELGPLFCRGRDKENCRILWFKVKHHKKGDPEKQRQAKLFIAFWLEKLQWEDFDNPAVIVQDMVGAGVSNMDIDVIKFLISSLELYFPALCNMLYIYEMHWVLNAIWKIIEKLLSEQSKAHLKFIKARDVMDYFDADQLPVHMGGTDIYEWSWPPPEQFRDTQDDDLDDESDKNSETGDEKMQSVLDFDTSVQEVDPGQNQEDIPSTSQEVPKEDGQTAALRATENIPPRTENDTTVKKVHFADDVTEGKENTDPRHPMPTSKTDKSAREKPKKKGPPKRIKSKEVHHGPLVSIKPGDSLIFRQTENKHNPKEMKSGMTLTNSTDGRVAYKIKTTSPDKYRVRPSSGQINPGASVAIEIIFMGGQTDLVVTDKFLVQSTELGEELAKSVSELAEAWKRVSKSTVVEHRLKCICETPPEALISNHDILKELQAVNKKVAKYDNEREKGYLSNKSSLRLVFLMQALMICLLMYLIYSNRVQPGNDATGSCYSHPSIVTSQKQSAEL